MRGQWHVNNDGEVGKCDAATKCPFDANGGHTKTKKEALKNAEIFNQKHAGDVTIIIKKKIPKVVNPLKLNFKEQEKLAGDDATAPEILTALANSHKEEVQVLVANNFNTPVEALDLLSSSDLVRIRTAVAQHPNTSAETLNKMMDDKDKYNVAYVHPHLLENPKLSPESLVKASVIARTAVSSHPIDRRRLNDRIIERADAPKEALMNIAQSGNVGDVDKIADLINHDNADIEVLEQLVEMSEEPEYFNADSILEKVAYSPKCSTRLLTKIAMFSHDKLVLIAVASNPNTSQRILSKLINDKNYSVSKAAMNNPNTPMKAILEKAERDAEE